MRIRVVAAILAVSVLFAPVSANASCGCSACPIDTHTSETSTKGWMRLDYSYEYSDQHHPRAGRSSASIGEIPGEHDEVSTLNQVQRIGLEGGLTDRLSVGVSLPIVHREHQHIHRDPAGDELETWNFSGLGDTTLLTKYAVAKGGDDAMRVSIIAGGIVPTGRTRVANNNGELAESGMTPGKRAYSLILGGSLLREYSAPTFSGAHARLPVFVSSTYQWNGQGLAHYKMGNTLNANLGATYPVLPHVGIITQVNVRVSRKDDAGDTAEEIEKTGGTFVYASPGLQLGLSENLWSYIYIQLPVYQRVNGIQLTSDSNLVSGISYRFSAL